MDLSAPVHAVVLIMLPLFAFDCTDGAGLHVRMSSWLNGHCTCSCDTAISSQIIPPPYCPLATRASGGYVTPREAVRVDGEGSGIYPEATLSEWAQAR